MREKRGWIRSAWAVAATGAGEVMMIKGSLGSTMKTIVNALEKRFPGKTAHEEAAA
jgi:UDP-N-acetylmuramoyl-tripeptide--D-alanyl-D-alanine ligase